MQIAPKFAAALIAAAAMATPVGAVTNVSSIRITNELNTWLQIGELIATQAGTGTNVALAGSAAGSGSYSGDSTPDRAIDGSINTDYYAAPYIYHSLVEANGFLTVTLAAPTTLSGLTIYGRTDGGFNTRDLFRYSLRDANGDELATGLLDARAGNGASATFAVSAVPEPAAWVMMIAGFGLVGSAMRRRRTIATA